MPEVWVAVLVAQRLKIPNGMPIVGEFGRSCISVVSDFPSAVAVTMQEPSALDGAVKTPSAEMVPQVDPYDSAPVALSPNVFHIKAVNRVVALGLLAASSGRSPTRASNAGEITTGEVSAAPAAFLAMTR